MHLLFRISVFLLVLLELPGCCRGDCAPPSGLVQLHLLRDGKNAVYGPDAFINKNGIRAFVLSSSALEGYVDFIDTFQSVGIFIQEGFPVILEINGVRADTFAITTVVTDTDGCCTVFQVTSVLRNGVLICEGTCEEIIDIEI